MKRIMRKLVLALMATGMMAGCICGCASSSEGEDTSQEVSVTTDNNVADLSTDSQLALMVANKSTWYVEPNEEWICYVGVSDLDGNGRLEITVSREEAGSYVNTQFYMYEVDETGTELAKVTVDLGDAERMPDISLNNVIDCYHEGSDYYYSVTDCDMSDYSIYEYDNYMMKLENGTLTGTLFSRMVFNLADDETPEKYYGADGSETDAKTYADAQYECAKTMVGSDCELFRQIMGFQCYDEESDFSEVLKLSYEKLMLLDEVAYEEYLNDRYSGSSSASLGLDEIGALYYTDIDEDYLKNKRWTSFYVSNFETGAETDYISNGGEGSRFETEVIFFANDGTGYYVDPEGEVINFIWSVNDGGSAEAVMDGDTYRNSIFGYTLVGNDGLEYRTIAFEYKNEYIYSMCE